MLGKSDSLICILGLPNKSRDEKLLESLELQDLTYLRELGQIALENEILDRFSRVAFGLERSKGQAGCAKAHIVAIKHFIQQNNLEVLVILEDDCELVRELPLDGIREFLTNSLDNKVLMLGGDPRKAFRPGKPDSRSAYRRLRIPPDYSYAYAISRRTALRIASWYDTYGLIGMSDWSPFLATYAKFFEISTPVFRVRPEAETSIRDINHLERISFRLRLAEFVELVREFGTLAVFSLFKLTVLRGIKLKIGTCCYSRKFNFFSGK